MNIGINLLPFRAKLGGAGNYAKNIVRELSEIDIENKYFLFITKSSLKHLQVNNPNFNVVINSFRSNLFPVRIFWEQCILPFQLRKRKIDILFTPSVAVPYLFPGRMVTTVHDIAYKRLKKKYSFFRRLYLAAITWLALKKSETIFTVSNFSKEEIVKEYNIPQEKIIVTYNGVGKNFFEPLNNDIVEIIKKKYNLPENFILYVGAMEPGKNLESLLRIFSDVSKEKKNNNLFLVMTGGMGWKKNSLFNLMKELLIVDKVLILPYIPDKELPTIFKLSKILIYISYYEGFGLPVLEGLASGVPVIASDIPSIKEFAGGSAILLNSSNEILMKKELTELLTNGKKRDQFIKKGLLVAENFNWKNSARIIHSSFNLKKS